MPIDCNGPFESLEPTKFPKELILIFLDGCRVNLLATSSSQHYKFGKSAKTQKFCETPHDLLDLFIKNLLSLHATINAQNVFLDQKENVQILLPSFCDYPFTDDPRHLCSLPTLEGEINFRGPTEYDIDYAVSLVAIGLRKTAATLDLGSWKLAKLYSTQATRNQTLRCWLAIRKR